MEASPRGRAVFGVFGLVVLGVTLRVVRRSPAATWLALMLAVVVVALSVAHAITPHPALPAAIAIWQSIFYFYATGSLIAYMLQDWVATTDELFAAAATFTLLAWAFAYVYTVVQAIEPGSFTAAVDPDAQRTWMELLFLSFTVLTSTGLSDVVPIEPFARSVCMIEQLCGLGYVAVLVSRVIGLTVLRGTGSE